MSVAVNPPPIQIPAEWAKDKAYNKFFTGLINTLYQLWSTVYGMSTEFTVRTTDDTPTAGIRVPVPNNKTVMVEATVVARRTGGTSGANGDSAWYKLMGAYKNINGTLTGIGAPSLVGGENQSGWDLFFTTSGEEIVIGVFGATNNDVTWEGSVSSYVVGS